MVVPTPGLVSGLGVTFGLGVVLGLGVGVGVGSTFGLALLEYSISAVSVSIMPVASILFLVWKDDRAFAVATPK